MVGREIEGSGSYITPFAKGQNAWNKGKEMSLESRSRLSDAKKLNPTRYWLGKSRDIKTNNKISKTLKNKFKLGIYISPNKGVIPSEETRKIWSKIRTGKNVGKSNPAWKNGNSRRRSTLLRELGAVKCFLCEFNEYLEIHHINGRNKVGSNELNNLVALCSNHHRLVHLGKIKL